MRNEETLNNQQGSRWAERTHKNRDDFDSQALTDAQNAATGVELNPDFIPNRKKRFDLLRKAVNSMLANGVNVEIQPLPETSDDELRDLIDITAGILEQIIFGLQQEGDSVRSNLEGRKSKNRYDKFYPKLRELISRIYEQLNLLREIIAIRDRVPVEGDSPRQLSRKQKVLALVPTLLALGGGLLLSPVGKDARDAGKDDVATLIAKLENLAENMAGVGAGHAYAQEAEEAEDLDFEQIGRTLAKNLTVAQQLILRAGEQWGINLTELTDQETGINQEGNSIEEVDFPVETMLVVGNQPVWFRTPEGGTIRFFSEPVEVVVLERVEGGWLVEAGGFEGIVDEDAINLEGEVGGTENNSEMLQIDEGLFHPVSSELVQILIEHSGVDSDATAFADNQITLARNLEIPPSHVLARDFNRLENPVDREFASLLLEQLAIAEDSGLLGNPYYSEITAHLALIVNVNPDGSGNVVIAFKKDVFVEGEGWKAIQVSMINSEGRPVKLDVDHEAGEVEWIGQLDPVVAESLNVEPGLIIAVVRQTNGTGEFLRFRIVNDDSNILYTFDPNTTEFVETGSGEDVDVAIPTQVAPVTRGNEMTGFVLASNVTVDNEVEEPEPEIVAAPEPDLNVGFLESLQGASPTTVTYFNEGLLEAGFTSESAIDVMDDMNIVRDPETGLGIVTESFTLDNGVEVPAGTYVTFFNGHDGPSDRENMFTVKGRTFVMQPENITVNLFYPFNEERGVVNYPDKSDEELAALYREALLEDPTEQLHGSIVNVIVSPDTEYLANGIYDRTIVLTDNGVERIPGVESRPNYGIPVNEQFTFGYGGTMDNHGFGISQIGENQFVVRTYSHITNPDFDNDGFYAFLSCRNTIYGMNLLNALLDANSRHKLGEFGGNEYAPDADTFNTFLAAFDIYGPDDFDNLPVQPTN